MEIPAILLLHEEYGKLKAGISSVHRQLVGTLREHVPDIPLYSTVLKATKEDKQDACNDGVELLLPSLYSEDARTPSLAWLTFDHVGRYPHIPSKVRSIVGHFDITSRAAIRIKKERFQDAKVILFAHDIPEDTEYYKGEEEAKGIGKKEKSILEDAQEADVVLSLGNKIFDHFQIQFSAIPANKRPDHFKFVPRSSKIFEDAQTEYKKSEIMVVLSIGIVTGVEKVMGLDLAAGALSIVAEKINIKWRVCVVSKDDVQTSKAIIDRSKSANLPMTLQHCDSLMDIHQHMMQAHLVLIPSRAEPFGLIGLEAIAAGVPVLISSRSGLADLIREHVNDLHNSIVDMDESEDSANVNHWAKNIKRVLENNKAAFETAARCRRELLSTEYWKESHQEFIKACTDGGNGMPQPAQVERRKRSASTAESGDGAKASKPEMPPLLPIKVEILEQVKPSVKTPKHMRNFATASEILLTEITMTDETLALLRQVVPEIKTVDDVLDIIESIKTLEKIKGVDVRSVRSGCLAFYLQCTDLAGLCKLWFMYRGGELSNMLFSCLLSEVRSQLGKRITVKATINVEDFRKAMFYRLTTSAAKGLDHTTSVDNIMTLPSPTRHVDHSSLMGLDLARFSRKDQADKGTVDISIHSVTFTARQVQTALQQVRKTEQRLSQLKHQLQLQVEKESSEAQIRSLSKQVTMLKEEKEKAQKVLLAHKVTIEQLQNTEQKVSQLELQLQTAKEGSEDLMRRLSKQVTMLTEENEKAQKDLVENKTTIEQLQDINKTRVDTLTHIIEKLTDEKEKLSNRNENLQDEVRTLRENNEALQKLLSEKTQELQLAQETSEDTAAKPESLFGQLKGKQTMERQNQADDSKRKEKQPAPEEFSSEASKEEQTDSSSATNQASDKTEHPTMKDRETAVQQEMSTNILLVGCKNNGKSHTGNAILEHEVFRVTRRGGTEKSSLGSSSLEVDGVSRKVTVVDTPGVSHEMTESEFEELVRAVKMIPEGFDAICLVWDYKDSQRNEDKEVQVFQSLHRLLGDGLYEHLVILVTHAQQEDIPEFLEGLPKDKKEITEQCNNRVIAIENRGNLANKQETLKTLIECISELSNRARRSTYSYSCPQKRKIHLGGG
ncbi:uncharacterized protein LOC118413097 [Branchiostoma floridae]|uniref:Uncharacterized protein LOC118413097 n=1 Tax=Branchiostoma floridae TaxID=7739 RepID=A0A9J7MM07_BRAFL|nr:uncharacterized protein LOC118413097 [Branchiostoma floridae]